MGELRAMQGEVFPRQQLRYNPNPSNHLPDTPTQEVKRGGPLGLFKNPIEADSQKRQQQLKAVAQELDYAGKLALVQELNGVHNTRKTVKAMEHMVWEEDPDSFTGQFMAYLLQDSAQRSRINLDARSNTYAGMSLNIIQRNR